MHIANPIYDVAFKYLLEDNKVAKIFLSAIIGETIAELEFSAQENVVKVEVAETKTKKTNEPHTRNTNETITLTVCRLDFSAKIKTETGFKTIGIELQKSKLLTNLKRFRKYLAARYSSTDNTYLVPKKKSKKKSVEPEAPPEMQEKLRQIYCIYILDYGMDLPPIPVLKVNYRVEDVFSGKIFPAKGEFIEGLHHLSWIVQIPQLKDKRRNELEKLLSVFDQSAMTDSRYILDIDDSDFPQEYKEVVRRLIKAKEDPKRMREMELEDDILNEIRTREEDRQKALAKAEQAEAKAEQAEAEKAEAKAETLEAKAKAEQAEAEKAEAKAETEKAKAEAAEAKAKAEAAEAKAKNTKAEIALQLLKLGTPVEQVAIITGLSEQEIINYEKEN